MEGGQEEAAKEEPAAEAMAGVEEEDLIDEIEAEAGGVAKKPAAGGETYKFELFHQDNPAGAVTVATSIDWAGFKAAVQAKVGFEIVSVNYDDDFGPHKEQDIRCKSKVQAPPSVRMLPHQNLPTLILHVYLVPGHSHACAGVLSAAFSV